MKCKFSYFFVALLMITMLGLCATASAQTQKKFKAIYCASNTTLYFVYDTETYTAGGTFTPEEDGSTALTITKVYTSPRTDSSSSWGEYSTRSNIKTVNFQPSFADYRPTSLAYWFNYFNQLETIENISYLNTSSVTKMGNMFNYCTKLKSLDVTHFDTSKVTDMGSMFYACAKLTSLDVTHFDTSNVMYMSGMFASCSGLTSLTVSNFDTSKVTSMGSMFSYCSSLTSLDLSNFDTSNVEYMNSMFYGCQSLKSLTLGSKFKTSKVTYMSSMFQNCSQLKSLDVSGFNTSSVTYMASMFQGCTSLTSLDVSGFNTSSVTNMYGMFQGCSGLTSLDVSNWVNTAVTNMSYMFAYCYALKSLVVSGFNTSNVTNMERMFLSCENLTSLDLSGFNTSNVTNMGWMFGSCKKMTSLDLSGFNTSKVSNMNYMFGQCFALTSLTLGSDFDTSKVTDMGSMFYGCSNLTSLDLRHFNTSMVMYMSSMFESCEKLTSLDLSSFDTSNVTSMGHMFQWCKKLERLTLSSNFKTSKVTDMSYMFTECHYLTSLDLGSFDTSNVTDMSLMFNECSSLTSLDLSGFNTSNVTSMKRMFMNWSKMTSYTFPKDFKVASSKSNIFYDNSSLRFIDFYASDDFNGIATVDRSEGEMFYAIPATTVIYLPHGVTNKPSSGELQNVVYTNGTELHCDDYYSEDKVDIELPRDFLAAKAQYSRTMSTEFGTCILPYDFHSNSDIQAYTLTQEHPETMYFEEAATVPAHTAFLFQKKGNAEFIEGELGGAYSITVNATRDTSSDDGPYEVDNPVTAQATAATTPVENSTWKAQGYYINQVIPANENTFYIAQDKFWKATTETTIPAHRATFNGTWYYQENQNAPSFSIMLASHNGETTRISALDVDREDAAPEYYDASGRRHNELQPGLNIVRKADGTVVKVMKK